MKRIMKLAATAFQLSWPNKLKKCACIVQFQNLNWINGACICTVAFIAGGLATSNSSAQSASATAQRDQSSMRLAISDAPLIGTAGGNAASSNAANSDSKRVIAEQSANLLKLATDLQQEVSHRNQLTISAAAIRNAGEIERLSKAMIDKRRQEANR